MNQEFDRNELSYELMRAAYSWLCVWQGGINGRREALPPRAGFDLFLVAEEICLNNGGTLPEMTIVSRSIIKDCYKLHEFFKV